MVDKKDIIDEAIRYFRANVLMASIDLKGDADNLLIYLTLCISGTYMPCVPVWIFVVYRTPLRHHML